MQGDVLEYLLIFLIGERDVLNVDRAADMPSAFASGASRSFGSVRISSTKRPRPAKPLANISAKFTSLRTGLVNVEMYRENVNRSTRSIRPCMMSVPPR